ncbi:YIP1 family protein [Aquicoccus sp. G2-2]|uniref:YIP1 family protein n=1 Tax=Aquicoccus sp. G2-2 TaxID=3092120 RepID=UPI002ADF2160|nr:YIP1 family protein [Aquicoccus sp. G2-2]MEA1113103.1 YIP1 family protein [Aquicoccus sp. G2-2]
MTPDWGKLLKLTLTNPKEAAAEVMLIRRMLSTEALWSTVILVAVLHTLITSLEMWVVPPPPEMVELIPAFFFKPALLAMMAAGAIVLMVFALYWAGRALGGTADLRDVLATFTWLELMMAGAQLVALVLIFFSPGLSDLFSLMVFFWGVWALIAFIDRSQGFDSPMRAIGVLVATIGLMLAGLVIFSLFVGVTAQGVAAHV